MCKLSLLNFKSKGRLCLIIKKQFIIVFIIKEGDYLILNSIINQLIKKLLITLIITYIIIIDDYIIVLY